MIELHSCATAPGLHRTSPLADSYYETIVCPLSFRVKMMEVIARVQNSKIGFPARLNINSPTHGRRMKDAIQSQSNFDPALAER